jgi:hypothetical protein
MARSSDRTPPIAAEIAALTAAIEAGSPQTLPLDKSYDSLDRLEDFFFAHLDDQLDANVGSYVGETLVANTGARWDPPRKADDRGRWGVIALPLIPKARFQPARLMMNVRRVRATLGLRDRTERYDIPRRRAALEALIANRDRELEGLRADLVELVGTAPPALDGGDETLAVLEQALKQLVAIHAPREQARRVRTRVILLLGELVQRAIGGSWAVCEEYNNADLGEFQSHGWAPSNVIRNIGPQRPPDLIKTELSMVIKGRSNK